MERVTIAYRFDFPDGSFEEYKVKLDGKTNLVPKKIENPPSWTKLGVAQCSHCPLKAEETPECPIAFNLSDIIERFKDFDSVMETKITVDAHERVYIMEASLQEGLFSLFGIIMATAGCPYMNILKPIARYHLPLQSEEEIIIRGISFYLLRQYFEIKKGNDPDLGLEKLAVHYADIKKVNEGMAKRLQEIRKSGDANQNAIVLLDAFSLLLGQAITQQLDEFEELFE